MLLRQLCVGQSPAATVVNCPFCRVVRHFLPAIVVLASCSTSNVVLTVQMAGVEVEVEAELELELEAEAEVDVEA